LLAPADNQAGKDLRVLRYMPEGKVPLAPELSVTFSQPMIAVTSQSDAGGVTPVKLTPQPKGSWRWIGTRTIYSTPRALPAATTYQWVRLAGADWRGCWGPQVPFETPPPTLRQLRPACPRMNVRCS
jgi:hypothetical protein